MYLTKVVRTTAGKKINTQITHKARDKMEEIGQAEDIRACIKAKREKTEQKKSTNTLQLQKGKYDTGCRRTRQQGACDAGQVKKVAVKP